MNWSVEGGAQIDFTSPPNSPGPAYADVSYYRPSPFPPWSATITAEITVFQGDDIVTFEISREVQVRTAPPAPEPQPLSVTLTNTASSVEVSWGPFVNIGGETYTACVSRIFTNGGPSPAPPDLPCTSTSSSVTDGLFVYVFDGTYKMAYEVTITDSSGDIVAQGERASQFQNPTY